LVLFRPFNNPTETYRYYSLPYCQVHDNGTETATSRRRLASAPDLSVDEVRQGAMKHKQRFGESMVGDRRETSPYDIHFLEDIPLRTLCTRKYTVDEISEFHEAIDNNYFFEMFIEDLPMWGYVGDTKDKDILLGETSQTHMYLFPHLHFLLGYNNSQVVTAKITTDVSLIRQQMISKILESLIKNNTLTYHIVLLLINFNSLLYTAAA
jgi:Endomembrane protein 70